MDKRVKALMPVADTRYRLDIDRIVWSGTSAEPAM
jgi:hypothetical protein